MEATGGKSKEISGDDFNTATNALSDLETTSQRQETTQCSERICDPFLDRFTSMMSHDNASSVLEEQEHM